MGDKDIKCKNSPHGCQFFVKTDTLRRHENQCGFRGKAGGGNQNRDQFQCLFSGEGCDFHIDRKQLENHQYECQYRRVPCPDGLCQEMVKLVELEKHIRGAHPDAVWEEQDPGSTLGRLWFIRSDLHFKSASNNWILNLWTHDSHTFVARFRKMHGLWYSWVYIIGGIREANHFVCEIATENPDGVEDSTLLYMGRVHPIDEPEDQICKNGDCFVMTNEVVQNHVTNVRRINMFSEGYDVRLGMDYTIERAEEAEEDELVTY